MYDHTTTRQQKLQSITQKDAVYQVWANSYNMYREAFAEFANNQPEEVRSFLWGYAESGRLMYQRMVNIACEVMSFPDE